MSQCLNCGKDTINPKYCSRSCAATNNGKLYPKRKPEGICALCRKPNTASTKYCRECYWKRLVKDWEVVTYGEVTGLRKYQKNSRIRQLAQDVFRKSGRKRCCTACGYDKHIEICHIRPISDFPYSARVAEINNISNLVALCPNHHWEFDKGLWQM